MHIAVAMAERIDGCSAKTLFNDIERSLQLFLQQKVYYCIIRPTIWLVLIIYLRIERCELAIAGMHSTTEAPLAVLITITLDIIRQFLIADPPVGIRLSCREYHYSRLFLFCLSCRA